MTARRHVMIPVLLLVASTACGPRANDASSPAPFSGCLGEFESDRVVYQSPVLDERLATPSGLADLEQRYDPRIEGAKLLRYEGWSPPPSVQSTDSPTVVLVSLVVDEYGVARKGCVQQSAGVPLDSLAVAAAMQCSFEPASLDGHAVASLVHLPYVVPR